MSGVQKTVLICAASVALVLGAIIHKVTRPVPIDRNALQNAGIFLFDSPRSIPSVKLQAASGQPWTTDALKGQWDMLFFGYTFCPDICPTTLAELRQLSEQLPAETRNQLQVTLVSVDPNRDTPEQLTTYLDYFNADYAGATGESAELAKLAKALSIAYIEPDTSNENYLVDHSGQVVLVNPAGEYVGFIRPPLKNDQLVNWLPRIMTP
ncbi:SCO family protein [Halopseudomonas sabulinigri]|uniref:SCO family protein n=1 Tax=Halopseudomonas sabulinigri TaxID=472181 RepID=UPI000B83F07F|nr:SCO family protein [Halopseudomonas sabulinigri]